MILPPGWSQSTDQRRIAAFVVVNTAVPLLGSGACFALWISDALAHHESASWANLIFAVVLLLPSSFGLFVMFVALFGYNTDKEMERAGYDKVAGRFRDR